MEEKEIDYLFVSTHFAPDFHYGGVVESGTRLFKYLRRESGFHLSTVSRNPAQVIKLVGNNVSCYRSILFHGFAVSLTAIFGLWRDIKLSKSVLINGIFTFPVTLAQLYAVIQKKPFIVATRGGLKPWAMAHKKWKKYFYIKFITLPLMKRAKYIHVTSNEEEKNLRVLGFNNIINVSNGVDLEQFEKLPDKYAYKNKYENKFVFLFMSRTDKEKGMDILIQSYRKFCSDIDRSGHIFIIAGPDHRGYFKKMMIDGAKENIEYSDGVYLQEKIELIRRSDVVVLPSYSESFGNIVAEALACERPVITTTGTPWNGIETAGCGYYIQPNVEELFQAMKKMFLLAEAEREEMGKRGRKYIFECFSWETKANEIFNYLQQITPH